MTLYEYVRVVSSARGYFLVTECVYSCIHEGGEWGGGGLEEGLDMQ